MIRLSLPHDTTRGLSSEWLNWQWFTWLSACTLIESIKSSSATSGRLLKWTNYIIYNIVSLSKNFPKFSEFITIVNKYSLVFVTRKNPVCETNINLIFFLIIFGSMKHVWTKLHLWHSYKTIKLLLKKKSFFSSIDKWHDPFKTKKVTWNWNPIQ